MRERPHLRRADAAIFRLKLQVNMVQHFCPNLAPDYTRHIELSSRTTGTISFLPVEPKAIAR